MPGDSYIHYCRKCGKRVFDVVDGRIVLLHQKLRLEGDFTGKISCPACGEDYEIRRE